MTSIEDLEAAFRAAQAAVDGYVRQVTTQYRERYPDSPDWKGQGPDPQAALLRARWSPEESAELGRLREAARRAVLELHRARSAAAVTDTSS
ncbi:hypothetical protein [Streptacidiphilus neutrinimicus]|uniref:hypothetical protein n=1 Tax=Streptacidiphilus neutrinimicus TaxID=105420 RepID=UPI001269C73F|nr:hypothetical protein [Streptacidiphilus neutrinimicus]